MSLSVRFSSRLRSVRHTALVMAFAIVVLSAGRPAEAQTAVVANSWQTVTVPSGWGGNLVFGGPLYDTGSFWTVAHPDRYTIPAGVSHVTITASLALGYACQYCVAYIVKNDSQVVAYAYGASADTGFGGAWFTATASSVQVTAGDYFTMRAYQQTGAPLSGDAKFAVVAIPAVTGASLPLTALVSGTIYLPAGWSNPLPFPGAAFDTGSFWSGAAPDRFVVPPGVHAVQLSAYAQFEEACTLCVIYILKNGNELVGYAYGQSANRGFGADWFTAFAPVVPVSPGDWFAVGTYQDTAGLLPTQVFFRIAALDGFGNDTNGLKATVANGYIDLPSGLSGSLALPSAYYDTTSAWSAAQPTRLTVPNGVGYVQVTGWVAFPWECPLCRVDLWKNDAEPIAFSYGASATAGFGDTWFTAFAPVVRVQAGDFFTIRTYQGNEAPVTAFVQLSMLGLGPTLPAPTMTSLSPSAAGVDQSVTITGFHFGAAQGTSTVSFAGSTALSADVTGWSDTSITVKVPSWAISGNVTVKVAGQTSNGKAFTRVMSPAITAVTPSWGSPGDAVTIAGTNFGAAGTVTFANNHTAAVTSWTNTSITVTVPAGASTGGLQVAVTATGLPSNIVPFTVGTEEVLYIHTDAIGSVRMITGAGGLVLEQHDYSPFGEEWPPQNSEAHIGFGGGEKDSETGSQSWVALNYFGARSLHAASGRFTAVDPGHVGAVIDTPQSWNGYAYVTNNPLRYVDPDGLCGESVLDSDYGSWKCWAAEQLGRIGASSKAFWTMVADVEQLSAPPEGNPSYQEPGPEPYRALLALGTAALLLEAGRTGQPSLGRETTVLGENMAQRVGPFAKKTGGRTLGFGATAEEWAAMSPQQRWRLNDGMLRARIKEGDAFCYIGQDPLRNPAIRQQFDLTRSELLRLESRGVPYQTVPQADVTSVLRRP